MQTNIRFTSYIAQLLVEREMILANVIQKIENENTFYVDFFFSKIVPFVR